MLKSKGLLYFLFPVVILIWGIVIYRVVEAFSDDKEPVFEIAVPQREELKKISRDTFSLLPIQQDPFLGTNYKAPVKVSKVVHTPKGVVEWPEILYLGQVSDAGKSSAIHIFQIQGKEVILEKGGTVEGVQFISSNTEGVTLVYKNKRKQYTKSI